MDGFEQLWRYFADLAAALTTPAAQAIALYFLGAVFVWSASAKLRAPFMTALAIVDFGVATQARRRNALLLGGAEFLLGLGLAAGATWRGTAAIAAAGLAGVALWTFTALIARTLSRGRSFACMCFGNAAAVLSWMTLVRTAVLALVASSVCVLAAANPGSLSDSDTILALVVSGALVGGAALAAVLADVWRLPTPPAKRALPLGASS